MAIEHGKAIDEGNDKVSNQLFKKLLNLIAEMKQIGMNSELKLFLTHDDANVKLWSATHLLSVFEDESKKAISEVEHVDRLVALEATIIKDLWSIGLLKV